MAMLLISFLAVSFCYALEKHHCSLGKEEKKAMRQLIILTVFK